MRRQHLPSEAGAHFPVGGGDSEFNLVFPGVSRDLGTRSGRKAAGPGHPVSNRMSGAAPGLPVCPFLSYLWGPVVPFLMEPWLWLAPHLPTHAPTGKRPCSLIRAPRLAGRTSQITAGLVSPRQPLHLLGIVHCQRGLAPDKGGRSAWLETHHSGLAGGWSRPGKSTEAGEPKDLGWGWAMVTMTTHLSGLGKLFQAPPVGGCRAMAGAGLQRGTWLDLSPGSPSTLTRVLPGQLSTVALVLLNTHLFR